MFTDDTSTSVLSSKKDEFIFSDQISNHLHLMNEWFSPNGLKLNPDKPQFIKFLKIADLLNLIQPTYLNIAILYFVQSCFLGIKVDSWHQHYKDSPSYANQSLLHTCCSFSFHRFIKVFRQVYFA